MTPDRTAARLSRENLVAKLAQHGFLDDGRWRSAWSTVPREHYVTQYLDQDATGQWVSHDAATDGPSYLIHLYGDHALTTQVTDGYPTSSSSQPSLMAEMLQALTVQPFTRVLEIGTGTGYNTALLCEYLGDDRVVSVEVDPELAKLAERRLNANGHHPTVIAGDGRAGHPDAGPYDRLIATVGFTRIPSAWLTQMQPGGIMVVPVGWGNARLIVNNDSSAAHGTFLPGSSRFMEVRDAGTDGQIPYPGKPDILTAAPATLPLTEVGVDDFAFLLSLLLPGARMASETRDGQVVAIQVWADDTSWARTEDGRTLQGGPRPLWSLVEQAHSWWVANDHPDRTRFGITVTQASQSIWLDHSDNTVVGIA